MMSRKHYQAIAEITKNILQGSGLMIPMINTLADYFKRDNPNFDKSRFRVACLNGDSHIHLGYLRPEKVNMEVSIDDTKNLPVESNLRPNTSTIVTSRNKVESVLAAGEIATRKMNENNKEITKKNRNKN
jgi:hypothetical protein